MEQMTMSLHQEGFDLIKAGKKTIEVRLYDEKRRLCEIGHKVIFQKLPDLTETLETEIMEIRTFKTFEALYSEIGFELLGRQGKTMNWMLDKTREAYTKDMEEKYGAVAIYIKVL